MKKKSSKSNGGWKRVLLISLCVLCSIILLGLIAVAIVLNDLMGSINRVDPGKESTMSSEEASKWIEDNRPTEGTKDPNVSVIDPSDITWETEDPTASTGETTSTHPDENHLIGDEEHLVNILLIGSDRRPGEGRGRSDAMILCTVNTQTNVITMTSILRDLYVQIPGYQSNRVNAAYAFGGISLLNQTLEKNFYIHVDANVVVDFTSFAYVVDVFGGVEIELTQAEANHLNSGYGWNLTAGYNWLDGEQALAYSRIRALDSDFGRTERQRNVLEALVSRGTALLDVNSAIPLVKDILRLVTTDLSDAEILGYVTRLFPVLLNSTIKTQSIPQMDAYQDAYIDEMMVLLPDLGKTRQFLRDTLLG